MSKVGAIVQARMRSTRLPGKVIKEVNSRSLLSYLVERLESVSMLDEIIVATSDQSQDDLIVAECEKLKVVCYRGSEDDVLDRFYKTAVSHGINPIVRITGDCPLILPELIDQACRRFLQEKIDYLNHAFPYPDGLADISVISFAALEIAWKEAKLPSEREHVVPFLYNHPERFKFLQLKVETILSKYRFTVDNPVDFDVVKHIIENLYKKPRRIFGLPELERYVKNYPEMVQMNITTIRNEGYQKSLQVDEQWKQNKSQVG